jgi:hypothetical protein
MKQRRIAILQVGLLLVSLFANAAVRNGTIRIKVLDSETRSLNVNDSGVPKNCDPTNYDAYCHSSKTSEVINTLLVQEGDGPPFRITCTIDSKWSRCIPLPKGESFDARKEKHGLTLYYLDDNGKQRKQLYTYVAGSEKSNPVEPTTASAPQPRPAPTENTGQVSKRDTGGEGSRAVVKCSFSSTPSGAEITLDGRYVGSTPSVLNVNVGSHLVIVSLPGFAEWKRELKVASGSELTVNAVLEKVQ